MTVAPEQGKSLNAGIGGWMAQRTAVTLQDDLDGGPADETVRFAIGGRGYEIDLSTANATRFRQELAPYLAHARKAGTTSRRPRRTAASRLRSRDIRAWARQQGMTVSERGRIPARITAQYQAAGNGTAQRLTGPKALGRVLGTAWWRKRPLRRDRSTSGHPRQQATVVAGVNLPAQLAAGMTWLLCAGPRKAPPPGTPNRWPVRPDQGGRLHAAQRVLIWVPVVSNRPISALQEPWLRNADGGEKGQDGELDALATFCHS
jgi:hypothetical protein